MPLGVGHSKNGLDLLFRVVSRICEYPWINATLYPVVTRNNDTIFHGMDEVIVEDIFPDGLDEFASAVSHELAALSIPVWMPT